MESITVNYSRKVSPGNYESVGIGGSIEFKPATEDLQKEYSAGLAALKLIIDARVAEVVGRSGGVFDDSPPARPEPDLGTEPEWVEELRQKRTGELLGEGNAPVAPPALPAPPAPPAPPVPVDNAPTNEAVDDDLPALPPNSGASAEKRPAIGAVDGEDVYLGGAKVFRVEMKRSKTVSKKVYAELRLGHEDLSAYGFVEPYVTARIFDPQYAAVVGSLAKMRNEETGEVEDVQKLNINLKDLVDVWGTFSVWNSNPRNFDINGTAIQKTQ